MTTLDQIRAELETWQSALQAADSGDLRTSLRLFASIADTSKIHLNVALIHDRLGERAAAIENLSKAIELDQYLAVGYFQRGCAYFGAAQLEEALNDYTQAQITMRSNAEINYSILGLDFTLKRSEVLFNTALVQLRLGRRAEEAALTLRRAAETDSSSELKAMIERSQRAPQECVPYSLPAGILYRPSAAKMQLLDAASQGAGPKPSVPTLDTSSTSEKTSPLVPSKKSARKRKTSLASSFVSSSLSTTTITGGRVPTLRELSRVIGADMTPPATDITGMPCAGVRVSHGPLAGLMAWRFIVEPDVTAYKRSSSSQLSPHMPPPPAIVLNFLLDTGNQKTFVPVEAIAAIGLNLNPGAEVTLRIQGIRTRCTVAEPDEAGRIGVSFMTAGCLTYYFDSALTAPVLYDGSAERPAHVPCTIRVEDLPRRKNWLLRILAIFSRAEK
uniref:NAD(P)H oxidase regulator n=1 Tax=Mycena chlorophos TaxID=658473 RepID=A0ABQ0LXK0_MYCCL|nr:NAD(P)H oxidase regulator [Mycena chlorophos]